MRGVAGYAGHRPQFWEYPERPIHVESQVRLAAGDRRQSQRGQRARSQPAGLQFSAGVAAVPCHSVPEDYMGVMARPDVWREEALPPPSASAPVPSLERVRGNVQGRRVHDNFVNKAVERCGPAVVRIDTERRRPQAELDADVFSFFFGVKPDQSERKVEGHGTGFCVEPSGIILTNAHVVQGQDRVFVTFPDGTRFEAGVLGTDEVIDLAALQVAPRGKPLPHVRLGSSAGLRVGDWAIACGNPLGLNNSCTLGIISSLDRSTGETGWDWMRHPLIQTDAAVNQGNSGGPLLNELGEVVGIVSMRALFGEGIAFAIPVDSVALCLESLLRRRGVPHAYLGMKLAPAPAGARGALAQMVLHGTPADLAGVREGDTIEEVDGQPLKRAEHLQRAVHRMAPGQSTTLKIRRDGKSSRVTVTAGDVKQLKELKERAAEKRGAKARPTFVLIPH
mmetsp:Transcript_29902/g.95348  ORF Transcript_29902/g.95348 Transcript_29902/m.95348 type:complete len:450 (-) Transcript_29902:152-1501(-)